MTIVIMTKMTVMRVVLIPLVILMTMILVGRLRMLSRNIMTSLVVMIKLNQPGKPFWQLLTSNGFTISVVLLLLINQLE